MKNPNRQRTPAGFTLVELLVVIAIIALLISIILPSLQLAKELARRAVCSSNVRHVALAAHLYAEEHEDFWPIDPLHVPREENRMGSMDLRKFGRWGLLGLLYSEGYSNDDHRLFYCPSAGGRAIVDADTPPGRFCGIEYWDWWYALPGTGDKVGYSLKCSYGIRFPIREGYLVSGPGSRREAYKRHQTDAMGWKILLHDGFWFMSWYGVAHPGPDPYDTTGFNFGYSDGHCEGHQAGRIVNQYSAGGSIVWSDELWEALDSL